jgi:Flp pilus assembly protein TadG
MITSTKMPRRLLKHQHGTAAIETAIVVPLLFVLALGVTDLGGGIFSRMAVNAASQAGAAYAVSHPTATLIDVQTAMTQAAGDSSFCANPLGICTVSLQSACVPAPAACVITVTATYAWTPWLPAAMYSWATSMSITYTTTVRVI